MTWELCVIRVPYLLCVMTCPFCLAAGNNRGASERAPPVVQCACVSSTSIPLAKASHVVEPNVWGGAERRGHRHKERWRIGGPVCNPPPGEFRGIGGLGCGEAADEVAEVSGDKSVENSQRGRWEVGRRLLQPREGTQPGPQHQQWQWQEIDDATFVL